MHKAALRPDVQSGFTPNSFTLQRFQTEFYTHFYLGYKNIEIPKSSSTTPTSCIKILKFFSNVRK
jgi:hypothetical protein